MFKYSAQDCATRIGYMIGDAFLIAFAFYMIYGLAFIRLKTSGVLNLLGTS